MTPSLQAGISCARSSVRGAEAKAQIPIRNTVIVDPIQLKAFMDMHGYPFGFGLSPFEFPRYPPSAGTMPGMSPNPAKLKERALKENPLFSARLNDFSRMYLRHASSLIERPSAFPAGHPMSSNRADVAMLEENDKLRKENLELRKRIEQMTKNRSHI